MDYVYNISKSEVSNAEYTEFLNPFVSAVVGNAAAVPEPTTLLLCMLALALAGGWRKWRG